jgi:hypothetical protein
MELTNPYNGNLELPNSLGICYEDFLPTAIYEGMFPNNSIQDCRLILRMPSMGLDCLSLERNRIHKVWLSRGDQTDESWQQSAREFIGKGTWNFHYRWPGNNSNLYEHPKNLVVVAFNEEDSATKAVIAKRTDDDKVWFRKHLELCQEKCNCGRCDACVCNFIAYGL